MVKLPANEVLVGEYLDGMSEDAIAEKYHASKSAVSLRLIQAGVQTRGVANREYSLTKKQAANYLELAELVKEILAIFHNAPGDPVYALVNKSFPEIAPAKRVAKLKEVE